MIRLVGLLFAALVLTGCSTTAQPEMRPSPSDRSVTSASPTPSTAQPNDMAACAEVADLLLPVQDLVSAIVQDGTGATVDRAQLIETSDRLREVEPMVTSRMNTYFAPFSSVVLQLDDIFDGRADGATTLDTGAYRDAAIEILFYCTDEVGFRAP